jgi:2-aminobenzoylacetyl-CoA thioesterase
MIINRKGEIANGLYTIGSADLPAFLVMAPEPALFDSGITFMGPLYIRDLKKHLGDPNRLRHLFITHSHFDHGGAAPYLKKQIRGLNIAASGLAAEIYKQPKAVSLIQSLSKDYEKRFSKIIGDEDVIFNGFEVDRILKDGEEIDLGGGWSFRVIATPGHTRDAVSFYFPNYKALICGESAGYMYDKHSIQPEFLSSYREYLASLEKLSDLDVEIVMLSHQYVLTEDDARGYLKKSLANTLEYKERIENLLDKAAGDQESAVQTIYKKDYLEPGVIKQDERSYLINLRAKVRAVAEKR